MRLWRHAATPPVWFWIIFGCLFSLGSTSSAGESLPETFVAKYILKKGFVTVGEVERRLRTTTNGHYLYESASHPASVGKAFLTSQVREHSEWVYVDDELRPLRYVFDRSGGNKERHVEIKYDWERQRVTNIINGDPWRMDIVPGTLDKLLYHLTLMRDLQMGRNELVYPVADGGLLKTYRFEVVGEDVIDTEIGRLKTVKLKHLRQRETFLWCAVDLNYLPVRMEQRKKGLGLLTLHIQSLDNLSYASDATPN